MFDFEKILYSILQSKAKKAIVILVTILATIGSVMMLPTELVLAKMLPGKAADTFTIYIDTPTKSSIDETSLVTQCVSEVLQKEQSITDFEIFFGMGAPLDYAGLVKGSGMKMGEESAEIVVNLIDNDLRDEASYTMVQRLRPEIHNSCKDIVGGTSIKIIQMPAGPPTLASIVLEVFGEEYEDIDKISNKAYEILRDTKGLVDVDMMKDENYYMYKIIPKTQKVQRSLLSVEQINKILYLSFEGMVVGVRNSIVHNDQIGIFLSLDEQSKEIQKSSKEYLQNRLSSLNLMNKNGVMIPLVEVVEIVKVQGDKTLYHKNLKPYVNVIAETDGESQLYPLLDARAKMIEAFGEDFEVQKVAGMGTYMFDLTLIDKQTKKEYLLRWDGEMKVTLDTFRDLGGAFIAALILIFLLFVIYYKSFSISAIILGGSFLSIIGVIVGHYIIDLFTQETFFLTATSLIGFIALMGISSRNALLLIDFTDILMKQENMEKKRAIAHATYTRAKPIFLTAVTIVLGSALLASDPIFGGLGVSLIFGTVAAVIVSLIFVPVLMDNTKAI